MTELEPVAYLSGMYREFIEGKRERVPLGVEVSLVNLNWPQQIPLVTLSSAQSAIAERDARIAELEAQLDEALAGNVVPSSVWMEQLEKTRAAEALLKEAGKVLEPFAAAGKVIDCPFGPALFADDNAAFQSGCSWSENGIKKTITWGDFRAARSLASKIGGGE